MWLTLHACSLQYVEFLRDQNISTEIQHQQVLGELKNMLPVPTVKHPLPF